MGEQRVHVDITMLSRDGIHSVTTQSVCFLFTAPWLSFVPRLSFRSETQISFMMKLEITTDRYLRGKRGVYDLFVP